MLKNRRRLGVLLIVAGVMAITLGLSNGHLLTRQTYGRGASEALQARVMLALGVGLTTLGWFMRRGDFDER